MGGRTAQPPSTSASSITTTKPRHDATITIHRKQPLSHSFANSTNSTQLNTQTARPRLHHNSRAEKTVRFHPPHPNNSIQPNMKSPFSKIPSKRSCQLTTAPPKRTNDTPAVVKNIATKYRSVWQGRDQVLPLSVSPGVIFKCKSANPALPTGQDPNWEEDCIRLCRVDVSPAFNSSIPVAHPICSGDGLALWIRSWRLRSVTVPRASSVPPGSVQHPNRSFRFPSFPVPGNVLVD
ncbi:hypothetical protein BDV19DRAFT_363788 [Aspergillus venezuelensis]